MLLFGISFGVVYPNVPKAVGMWFEPRELGKALGAITVGAASGMAIALMAGASLSSLLGDWKAVMWLTAVISFGALILWIALARERPIAAADPVTRGVSAKEELRGVLRVRDVWLISLILFNSVCSVLQ